MAVDNSFFVRQLQKRKEMIVAWCAFTNMPFVVCDPESFDDQVFVFESEAKLQEFAKDYTNKKILLRGIKYTNKDFLSFFSMLYTIGVNDVVFINNDSKIVMELGKIIKKPNYDALPAARRPLINAGLQLCGIYFMQEAGRPVPKEEKENLLELEEELAANLYKSSYIIPVEFPKNGKTEAENLKEKKYNLPLLKNKEDEILQPIFTDALEFSKFNRENKFKAMVVPFSALEKLLIKNSKGFLLNPSGFHISMPEALLKALPKRFE